MKKIIITITVMTMCSLVFAAGEPMAYLKLGSGARATAMGGAFTAVADDTSGMFYNPAGITSVLGLQFLAETYLLSFGRNVSSISACRPFTLGGHSYSLGLSWLYYSAGSDIEARSTNSPLPERTISDSSHLVTLTFATDISERLHAGANAKMDLRLIDDVKGTGFGFDAGIMMKIIDGLKIGLCASNLSSNIWWDNRNYNEPAPQSYSLGAAYDIKDAFGAEKFDVLFSADLVLNSFGFMKFKAGAELKANDIFFLRAGYNEAFTAGCGVIFRPAEKFSMRFDYALVFDTISDASINHRIGAVFEILPGEENEAAPVLNTEEQKGGVDENPW